MGADGWPLNSGQFWDSTCWMHVTSPDFLSKLNCVLAHPMGVWGIGWCFERHHIFGVKETQLTLPCVLGLRWLLGQGSNESGTLHPEAVTSYRYFQSFWENRIVRQMDCDRAVSCPDPATHMPCVPGKIIWTADTCYMGSLNILPVINTKSLFTFHGQFCSFSTRICSFEKIFLPTALGWERIFMCQIMIIPLL